MGARTKTNVNINMPDMTGNKKPDYAAVTREKENKQIKPESEKKETVVKKESQPGKKRDIDLLLKNKNKKQKKVNSYFCLDYDLMEAIRKTSKEKNISMSELVSILLRGYFD